MRTFLQRTLIALLPVFAAGAASEKLADVRNYVLYYGAVADDDLAALGQYDLVVIDPQVLGEDAAGKIAALKSGGALVIGYLSYFEVADWHRYRSRVPAEWHLKIGGETWTPWGNNHAVDLTVPEWRALLVELTASEIMAYGCDGVFMDTLADLDHPDLPEEIRSAQLQGLETLMQELRQAYPDFIFIGNWTLQGTLPVMAPYVDVICWENFQPAFFDDANRTFMNGIAARLEELRREFGFEVAALWASTQGDPEKQAGERRAMAAKAESLGYWWYYCLGDYHNGYWKKRGL